MNWIFGTMLLLGVALMPVRGATRPEPVAQARVVKLTGSATFKDAAGKSGNLQVGSVVYEGTTIDTSIGGGLVLDLGPNGQALNLKDNSTLTIDKLTLKNTGVDYAAETSLNLQKGRLMGNVKKLSAASRFEVKTARGVAGIRGTSFELYAVGIFRCITGQIVVTISNLSNPLSPPQAFTVMQGQSVNAGGDTVPALKPIPPAELQMLMKEAKELPRIVIVGIAQRPSGPGGLPPQLPKGPPPVQADINTRKDDYIKKQAEKAANDALNAAQQQGIRDPETLSRIGPTAANAYVAQYNANPDHPEIAGTAGAVAAVSSLLAGGNPTQVSNAAGHAAQAAIIYLQGILGNPFVPAVIMPELSPLIGQPHP